MKLRTKYYVSVNIIICLIGVILIMAGIANGGQFVRPLLEAIGIGLLAAGAINILDRAVTLQPPPPPVTIVPRIEVVAEKRISTPQSILDSKYEASKIDILGVSLTHALEELVNDPGQRIIDRLLKNNLQLRLQFVHPNSPFLEQRAREDKLAHADLVKRQRHAVELCKVFYDQLRTAYDTACRAGTLDTHLTGSLQIKLLDFCPYMTIYRLNEDVIYWGIYTSSTQGVNLPLFKTSESADPAFYKHLHQHIHGLLERDLKHPLLVEMPELGEPKMDMDFYIKVLA